MDPRIDAGRTKKNGHWVGALAAYRMLLPVAIETQGEILARKRGRSDLARLRASELIVERALGRVRTSAEDDVPRQVDVTIRVVPPSGGAS